MNCWSGTEGHCEKSVNLSALTPISSTVAHLGNIVGSSWGPWVLVGSALKITINEMFIGDACRSPGFPGAACSSSNTLSRLAILGRSFLSFASHCGSCLIWALTAAPLPKPRISGTSGGLDSYFKLVLEKCPA
jgi:hypothetical protein